MGGKSVVIEQMLEASARAGDTRPVVKLEPPIDEESDALLAVDHRTALITALNCGGDSDYAKVEAYLARKAPLDRAAGAFAGSYWDDASVSMSQALMARYMDAGYFSATDSVVIDASNGNGFYSRPLRAICRTLANVNLCATVLLIERGALRDPGLADDLAAVLQHYGTFPRTRLASMTLEERFQAAVEARWGAGASVAMARFTALLMRQRLEEGGVPERVVPEGVGARAGRGDRRRV